MSIKFILSDLDGVIRRFPESRDLAIEEKYGLPPGSLFQTAFKYPTLQEAVCGRITDEEWRLDIELRLVQQFEDLLIKEAVRLWSEYPGEVDNSYLEYLAQTFPSIPVAILTNGTTRLHLDLNKLGLDSQFYKVFNSADIGICKPDRKVFLHVLETLNCNAGEILFIDDSSSHIIVAQELGFKTHHYQSVEHFKSRIEFLRSTS